MLEAERDFSVVGEAGNGTEALRLVEQLKPGIIVLDIVMSGLGGLEVTRQISRRFPDTRVVILTMHANEAYVVEALQHGALGYVLKCATAGELAKAIREVMAGRRYLSPPLSGERIAAYLREAGAQRLDRYETLTTREREVLQLCAEGLTSAQIGGRLVISPRTVEIHRANLMRKLGLHTLSDLVRYAVGRGLVSSQPYTEPGTTT